MSSIGSSTGLVRNYGCSDLKAAASPPPPSTLDKVIHFIKNHKMDLFLAALVLGAMGAAVFSGNKYVVAIGGGSAVMLALGLISKIVYDNFFYVPKKIQLTMTEEEGVRRLYGNREDPPEYQGDLFPCRKASS